MTERRGSYLVGVVHGRGIRERDPHHLAAGDPGCSELEGR